MKGIFIVWILWRALFPGGMMSSSSFDPNGGFQFVEVYESRTSCEKEAKKRYRMDDQLAFGNKSGVNVMTRCLPTGVSPRLF